MTLKQNFCSSPWIHTRITNSGQYDCCRWSDGTVTEVNIAEVSPKEFFQQYMQPLRDEFLAGGAPAGCHACREMDQHGKVSGRQRQLLKIGVRLEQFEKTLASSPWIPIFTEKQFTQMPQDWQVDLGNYCNSACVFCAPAFSSRLAQEHLQLGLINQLPPKNWADDPVLVAKFVESLEASPHIQYIHFIGGETVITPAFKTILSALIRAGLNSTVTLGFTTNLSVWKDDVADLLSQFANVNLGMSVEAFKIINDYVRWPTCLPTVYENLDRWLELAQKQGWLLQFRTTPTLLTAIDLVSVYEYAWHHNIAVESCNFLQHPEFLRVSVLPEQYRKPIIDGMKTWLASHPAEHNQVINTRHPDLAQAQIVQDLQSYVRYLEQAPDESYRLPDLVQYLKRLESVRGNSVLLYRPEYEELFRTAGY